MISKYLAVFELLIEILNFSSFFVVFNLCIAYWLVSQNG